MHDKPRGRAAQSFGPGSYYAFPRIEASPGWTALIGHGMAVGVGFNVQLASMWFGKLTVLL